MNSTERYKHIIGVYTSPSAKHDHLTDKNEYWRVNRDLAAGPSGSPQLRQTPYPKLRATTWPRHISTIPAVPPFYATWDPLKSAARYLQLQRMLDLRAPEPLKRFFRLCKARSVAYGNTFHLKCVRAQARNSPTPTIRQKRISILVTRNLQRLENRREQQLAA